MAVITYHKIKLPTFIRNVTYQERSILSCDQGGWTIRTQSEKKTRSAKKYNRINC